MFQKLAFRLNLKGLVVNNVQLQSKTCFRYLNFKFMFALLTFVSPCNFHVIDVNESLDIRIGGGQLQRRIPQMRIQWGAIGKNKQGAWKKKLADDKKKKLGEGERKKKEDEQKKRKCGGNKKKRENEARLKRKGGGGKQKRRRPDEKLPRNLSLRQKHCTAFKPRIQGVVSCLAYKYDQGLHVLGNPGI